MCVIQWLDRNCAASITGSAVAPPGFLIVKQPFFMTEEGQDPRKGWAERFPTALSLYILMPHHAASIILIYISYILSGPIIFYDIPTSPQLVSWYVGICLVSGQVEQLGQQLSEVQADLAALEDLGRRAEEKTTKIWLGVTLVVAQRKVVSCSRI